MSNLDTNGVENNPTGRMMPAKDIAHLTPRFFEIVTKTNRIDENTGLPVFHTQEYVELLIAGDKGSAPVKRVNDAIKEQFATHYTYWKSKKINADMVGDGIPLSLWPVVPAEMVRGLEFINVYTVQQLANLNDNSLGKPGTLGLRDIRDKARAFIESAKSMAPIAKLEAENGELKQRLDLLQSQMKELLAVKTNERATAAPQEQEQSMPKQFSRKTVKVED
jgi:hypothetical protein